MDVLKDAVILYFLINILNNLPFFACIDNENGLRITLSGRHV